MVQKSNSKYKDAIVVVIEKDGRYLFIKRSDEVPAGGYWCPVSGKIEQNETQEDAVVRETLEEVGLTVQPVKKVWECETRDGNYLLHWWSVNLVSGDAYLASKEIAEIKWVTLEEMLRLKPIFEKDIEYFIMKETK